MSGDGLTDVSGIRVGHYTDAEAATGCTVVLCEASAVGGVDVRGPAPGTRETDLLHPTSLVSEVHAVLLSGGSAFGLDAASGVVRYLDERRVGYNAGGTRVPIVPAASLFDLGVATDSVRPGPEEGYRACQHASSGPIDQGSVGAGTGATVAKLRGMERAIKGGLGTSSLDLGDGLTVGAIAAVNAVGGIFEPATGVLVAGPRRDDDTSMHDPIELLTGPGAELAAPWGPSANTTIGAVATNARLTKVEATLLAAAAHDGLAWAVRPAHTLHDGDTMFGIATGALERPADMVRLCAAASHCMSTAIVRGVRSASGLAGIPAVLELANDGPA